MIQALSGYKLINENYFMIIRKAKSSDYEAVVSLLCQFAPLAKQAERIKTAIGDIERQAIFIDTVESNRSSYIIAIIDNLVVSMCYLNILPTITKGKKPFAVIEHVITDRMYRRKGLGKQVIECALKLAEEAKCYKVMLMTESDNQVSHHFYESCGFESVSKTAFMFRST